MLKHSQTNAGLMLFAIAYFLAWCRIGYGQDCLRPDASEDRQIPFQDIPSLPRLPRQTQAIVTSYQFFCCGDVTNWQAFVSPLNSDHNITLQIWRPSAGEEEGCFMLVGETSLFIAGDGNQDSSRGVQMGNRISVRPGDVVGYYQDTVGQQGISMQGEGVQLDNSVTDVQVWYHTETVEEPLVVGPSRCVHRVGQEGQLRLSTQAAPAITVEISTSECTILPTTSTPMSQSTEQAQATSQTTSAPPSPTPTPQAPTTPPPPQPSPSPSPPPPSPPAPSSSPLPSTATQSISRSPLTPPAFADSSTTNSSTTDPNTTTPPAEADDLHTKILGYIAVFAVLIIVLAVIIVTAVAIHKRQSARRSKDTKNIVIISDHSTFAAPYQNGTEDNALYDNALYVSSFNTTTNESYAVNMDMDTNTAYSIQIRRKFSSFFRRSKRNHSNEVELMTKNQAIESHDDIYENMSMNSQENSPEPV